MRSKGTVKWFDAKRGFGFIVPDDEPQEGDVFAHFSSISGSGFRTLLEGQRVEFDEIENEKGCEAQNIVVLSSPTPKQKQTACHSNASDIKRIVVEVPVSVIKMMSERHGLKIDEIVNDIFHVAAQQCVKDIGVSQA